jgi:3-deoxy-manno-octulosonate cytidylyltransferase (CMP-KDO synthetase)
VKEGFDVVIPARLASTRLPGKLLLDIGGKPLIRHAWESAEGSEAASVTIATDAAEIRDAVAAFCPRTEMTSGSHTSGTERIAEVVRKRGLPPDRIVVNVQGDEYGLPSALIDQVAALLSEDRDADMATLCEPIRDEPEWRDPNVVKVVFSTDGRALEFSRSPIPLSVPRFTPGCAFRHIGIYAYRAGFLLDYAALSPTEAEKSERLEQLRALDHGHRIRVAQACARVGVEINSPADLESARRLAAGQR